MIETHGPALDAAVAYERERITRDPQAARREAYLRRAARVAQAEATAAGTTRGLATVLRGWRLPGSEAWHVAR